MTLDELQPGIAAEVVGVSGEGSFRRRLMELGLLPGTAVLRTGRRVGGDPLSVCVRGAVLSLRRIDANNIMVATT
jgi:ferrous iron transport protein A